MTPGDTGIEYGWRLVLGTPLLLRVLYRFHRGIDRRIDRGIHGVKSFEYFRDPAAALASSVLLVYTYG